MTAHAGEPAELLGQPELPEYEEDEQRYSAHVRETLLQMLRGNCDHLELVARYHQEPGRLGILPLPKDVHPESLRFTVVERILTDCIRFLHDGSEGGPATQTRDEARGIVVRVQDFPTRFPHIVLERTDDYDGTTLEPVRSVWSVYRLQNQRRNIQINRVLDAVGVGLNVLGMFGRA